MIQPMKQWELVVYYTIIFFILYEWLVPIMELTNTGFINYFMLFIVLSIVCILFKFPIYISLPLRVGYILWFITLTHSGYHLLQKEGLQFLWSEVTYNIGRIFALEFVQVTNSLRTLLFFVLIWMLMYLIHHWLTVRYSLFYFIVMTVFFIATLDTFSPYDGKIAIVKVLLYGLLLTGILFGKRLISEAEMELSFIKKITFVLPLLAGVAIIGVIAYNLPKAQPQWADPVPFIKGVTTGSTVSKVGYDEDDSRLGGAFEADDTLVFTAVSAEKRYWRIDSRDTYTSKGWEQSYDDPTIQPVISGEMLVDKIADVENIDTVNITMNVEDNYVLTPYGTYNYHYPEAYTVEESVESGHREAYVVDNRQEEEIPNYTINVSEERYSLQQLRATDMSLYDDLDASFDRYLQLPDNLPQRVRDLAVDITESVPTAYQKARAIENYFALNGFRYSTSEVAIPSASEDYVDQFLFETKIGYCDNFSTSMVVLMRSLGIPTRWVKGFVTGDAIDNGVYEITNNNAHSWVEVYLVGVGWVPFEPTIGFNGTLDINYDLSTEEQLLEQEAQQEQTPQQPQPTEPKEDTANTTAQTMDWGKFFSDAWQMLQWFVYALLAVGMLVGLWLYRSRYRWLPKYYIKQAKNQRQDWSSFEKNYKHLVKQLKVKGLVRHKGETLSAFATRVDEVFQSTEMTTLTRSYEAYLYGNELHEVDFNYLHECWEYLINRTTG